MAVRYRLRYFPELERHSVSDTPLIHFRQPGKSDIPIEIFLIQDNLFLTKKAHKIQRDPLFVIFWITGGCGRTISILRSTMVYPIPNSLSLLVRVSIRKPRIQ